MFSDIFRVEFPNKDIFPFEGLSKRASRCKKVDLPDPEGPTSATIFPDSKFKLILLSTLITELLFIDSK